MNHSFPTNPNRITNCFQLFSLFTTLQTTFAQCVRLFLIFETAKAEQELLKYAYKLKVRLDVYDFDALSDDDPIGHTTILLSDIIENGEERRKKVYELRGGKYSKATL